LLKAGFYPASAKNAESRLKFYSGHFNTVEVDSTYYALPSQRNALRKVQPLRDAKVIYVIFNKCYGDYGMRNAATMRRLLAAAT